jgi:DNA-binding CsgD family transcriptional regulator
MDSMKPQLTEREGQLLLLMRQHPEFTGQEMADVLKINGNTLKAHRRNLYRELRTTNVASTILKAMELGLVPK